MDVSSYCCQNVCSGQSEKLIGLDCMRVAITYYNCSGLVSGYGI